MIRLEQENAKHFLPTVEIKDYNITTDGQNVFDHPGKMI